MQKVNINKPLKVKDIYFKHGSLLHNKIVFIVDHFLIVANDEEDAAPNWYNMDTVECMEGVEELKMPRQGREVWL